MTRRPSPSMIVAIMALVVALGGTALAASGLINGAKIKNGTIAGKKLKKHTLTSTQINLAKLGAVPSAQNAANAAHATSADNASDAAHAGNADQLGGVAASQYVQGGGQTFANAFQLSPSTVDTPVYTIPNVGRLSMSCSSAANTAFTLLNDTGSTVFRSSAGVEFTSGLGADTDPGGATISPGGTLLGDVALGRGQYHVSMVWPASAPSHGADFTLGWYVDGGTGKCTLLVTGFVR